MPKNWKIVKLSEVARIKYGKDHKKQADGEIPVYGTGGIMRYVDTALYDKKSVLIPRKGSLGNLYFVSEPFWTVDTLFYTEIDETQIMPEYLYYKLKTYDLVSMNVGSAVPSLTTAILNPIELEIPDLKTQAYIVSILGVLDDKIENNKKINHHLVV
jgi:type I restriction enzyme S subunit